MPSLRTRIAYETQRAAQAMREIEAAIDNKANASTAGGLSTSLAAKADASAVDALVDRVSELEERLG